MTLWQAVLGSTHTQTHSNILCAAARGRCCGCLAWLPVMRLWQRQRVVYVMAAETFHRRDSLRRACCQIVCENKSEGKNESMRKKRARKKRKCAQLLSRTACAVSHYFSYSTENSKSRDTLIKMCTHTHTHKLVETVAVARPRPHTTHAQPYQLPKGKTAKCRHFQLRRRRRRRRQQASSLSGSKTQQLTLPFCPSPLPQPQHTQREIATSSMATVGA